MNDPKTLFQKLPGALLSWYDAGHRQLPWRGDRDPYHIWLSEIMLQQTRVEAVKGYYERFLKELPDISSLAKADEELLYKLWEGLGYYSRVRNLKKAAQQIIEHHGGVFPAEYAAVKALPGIGEYTAGAICSIAFDQPTPAVDGNVLRVVSRLTNDVTPIDRPAFKKKVTQDLAAVYPERAGDFTQALMELGATLCGPNRAPACDGCPCKDFCLGHFHNTAAKLPVKMPKNKRRREKMTVLIMCCDGFYAVNRRPNKGLLAGLWEFPNMPGFLTLQETIGLVEEKGGKIKEIYRVLEKKHIFTHVEWDMRGVYLETAEKWGECEWFTPEQITSSVALPTAFRQFWERTEDTEMVVEKFSKNK